MRRTTAVLGVAALVLALSSCSSSGESSTDAGASPSASPGTTETPTVITAPAGPTQGAPATETEPPATFTASPDETQTAALVAALESVVPGVAADQEQTVAGARDLCLDISQGKDDATLSSNAVKRFAPSGTPAVTDEQAAQLVQAVRYSFCHA